MQDSLVAFNYVLENVMKRGADHVHLLHVVPDLFTSPASGSIHYCSSPDPETERALVGAAAQPPQALQPRPWEAAEDWTGLAGRGEHSG